MTEVSFVESKDLREQAIDRIEVLEKVKQLFLIPDWDMMTIKQVADYYEIDIDTLKKCYKRNKLEIDSDGVAIKTIKDFLKGHFVPLENSVGKSKLRLSENIT